MIEQGEDKLLIFLYRTQGLLNRITECSGATQQKHSRITNADNIKNEF
jgi:hypothetical protein